MGEKKVLLENESADGVTVIVKHPGKVEEVYFAGGMGIPPDKRDMMFFMGKAAGSDACRCMVHAPDAFLCYVVDQIFEDHPNVRNLILGKMMGDVLKWMVKASGTDAKVIEAGSVKNAVERLMELEAKEVGDEDEEDEDEDGIPKWAKKEAKGGTH